MKTFIEILKGIVVKLGGTTKNNSSEFGVIKAIEEAVGAFATNTQNSINGLVEDVTAVEDRVTALEEGGGGSGGGSSSFPIVHLSSNNLKLIDELSLMGFEITNGIDITNPPIFEVIGNYITPTIATDEGVVYLPTNISPMGSNNTVDVTSSGQTTIMDNNYMFVYMDETHMNFVNSSNTKFYIVISQDTTTFKH